MTPFKLIILTGLLLVIFLSLSNHIHSKRKNRKP